MAARKGDVKRLSVNRDAGITAAKCAAAAAVKCAAAAVKCAARAAKCAAKAAKCAAKVKCAPATM